MHDGFHQQYRDLQVWQKSMDVAVHVFDLTLGFNRPRWFALVDQLHRSSISVPSNIAEGHGRRSRGDFIRFLSIANGSLHELETQLILLTRIEKEAERKVGATLVVTGEIGRMLNGLHHSLRSRGT